MSRSLKSTAAETLFLELALRGYDLSKTLRSEAEKHTETASEKSETYVREVSEQKVNASAHRLQPATAQSNVLSQAARNEREETPKQKHPDFSAEIVKIG